MFAGRTRRFCRRLWRRWLGDGRVGHWVRRRRCGLHHSRSLHWRMRLRRRRLQHSRFLDRWMRWRWRRLQHSRFLDRWMRWRWRRLQHSRFLDRWMRWRWRRLQHSRFLDRRMRWRWRRLHRGSRWRRGSAVRRRNDWAAACRWPVKLRPAAGRTVGALVLHGFRQRNRDCRLPRARPARPACRWSHASGRPHRRWRPYEYRYDLRRRNRQSETLTAAAAAAAIPQTHAAAAAGRSAAAAEAAPNRAPQRSKSADRHTPIRRAVAAERRN